MLDKYLMPVTIIWKLPLMTKNLSYRRHCISRRVRLEAPKLFSLQKWPKLLIILCGNCLSEIFVFPATKLLADLSMNHPTGPIQS